MYTVCGTCIRVVYVYNRILSNHKKYEIPFWGDSFVGKVLDIQA